MSGYNYILSMSKCGGHWEWSLPGSLSFSVVLLRPTPSQRDGSAILRGHASHERYTVSNVEGREINLHRSIPRAPGIEPGAAAWQAHTLPLALLQPSLRYCNPPCDLIDRAYFKQVWAHIWCFCIHVLAVTQWYRVSQACAPPPLHCAVGGWEGRQMH